MNNSTETTTTLEANIKQIRRIIIRKPGEVISWRGARNVSKRLYESVYRQVQESLPFLELHPEYSFTAEQLCGKTYWGNIPKQQRLLGKCLAHAVDERLLPLEIINRKKYPLLYKLKK